MPKQIVLPLAKHQDLLRQLHNETTWGNTGETAADWGKILEQGNDLERFRLFQHLFIESNEGRTLRQLFSVEELRLHLLRMNKKLWRSDAEKKRKVWRLLYADIKEPIPELDWRFDEALNGG